MVQPERIKALNAARPARGRFVVYWMQASQRAECNHALEYAIERANEIDKPLVVFFGLTSRYPEANERHYRFMLEGLHEVAGSLRERGIGMVVRVGSPEKEIIEIGRDAALVVVDRDYLRLPRRWRATAARRLECPLIQVETNAVVPVEIASTKEEYAAATIRPKIRRELERFLAPLRKRTPRRRSVGIDLETVEISNIDPVLAGMRIDRSVPSAPMRGGTSEARNRLRAFIAMKLDHYGRAHNDPNEDCRSGLSPYLHFGQISPLAVALEIMKSGSRAAGEFLEELIVRRELSINFVYFNERYDSFEGLPPWARSTLLDHAKDRREYVYGLEELDRARTHDPYWNAAQTEVRITGSMHGYMRMYWGKKILEWSPSPERAFETALRLNNRYELDGRDPNGFAGVAWCFGKHDRPWARRAVFGMVRYMNAAGLERKFDAKEYVGRIAALGAPLRSGAEP